MGGNPDRDGSMTLTSHGEGSETPGAKRAVPKPRLVHKPQEERKAQPVKCPPLKRKVGDSGLEAEEGDVKQVRRSKHRPRKRLRRGPRLRAAFLPRLPHAPAPQNAAAASPADVASVEEAGTSTPHHHRPAPVPAPGPYNHNPYMPPSHRCANTQATYPFLPPPLRPLGPSFPRRLFPTLHSHPRSPPNSNPRPRPAHLEASIQLVRDVMSLSSILEMGVERDKVRLRDGKWVNFVLPGTVKSDVPDPVPQHQLPPPPPLPHSYPGQYGGPPGYGGEFYPPPQQGPGMHMGGMGPPPGMEGYHYIPPPPHHLHGGPPPAPPGHPGHEFMPMGMMGPPQHIRWGGYEEQGQGQQ
ncbi:hypothetical protein M422DRAFT_258239 [Sphaerobolus stellatus SS14]|uniref:Uncharacterized protein n=1 Tax=Sphaerobolus stellatus (strain SS14) TaxID=990650 RepID=A0A0C9UW38_SPHS4|nr:hypothetical protein M422DRAFT_258239 [Sphaerobolus stellatus SS14]